MLGFYTPLVVLQAFCVYHAYRNNVEQRWYYLIIFLPAIGSLFYLYHHFYSRRGVEAIGQSVKHVMNSNYRIEQLEKAHRFADNVTNKVNLADAYVTIGRNDEAIVLYELCMAGFMSEDSTLRMKLLKAHFNAKHYNKAIALGHELLKDKSFRNAEERIAFAWALHMNGQTTEAEAQFEEMNKTFTNYTHRLEYCRFLSGQQKIEKLREVLQELLEEFEHMKGPERRLYRETQLAVREMARVIKL